MGKVHESAPIDADTRSGVTAHTADGSIKDRPLEGGPYDLFYVSPEQKEEYGISPDETLRWVRDADQWRSIEKLDRIEQVKAPLHRGGMAGRLVTTPDYDKVYIGGGTNGDLVLMAIPNSVIEQQQAETDAASASFEYGMIPTEDGYVTDEEFMERRPEEIKRRMKFEHEYHLRTGLIDPSRRNMTLMQADAALKRQGVDVEAKQEMLRNGGHHSPVGQEDFVRLMSGDKSYKKSASKSVSMGDSGFKRNPNSPLAQAQRKTAQGG